MKLRVGGIFLNEIYRGCIRERRSRVRQEDMVGRFGGKFERDGDQSLEKVSTGQKCNNNEAGSGPTWVVISLN